MTAREILETTDWVHLIHAHGTGADDVADLETLIRSDAEAMRRAVDALDGAYLHQSAIFPATPPALSFVLAVLSQWGDVAQEHPVAPMIVARLGQLPEDLPPAWRDSVVSDLKELGARL